MSTAVRTNELCITINREALSEAYDVFAITTDDKYIKSGAYILDSVFSGDRICSVLFISGKKFYVLMKRSPENKTILKQVIASDEMSEELSFANVSFQKLEKYIIAQLLLKAMSQQTVDK